MPALRRAQLLLTTLLLITACGEQTAQLEPSNTNHEQLQQLDYQGFMLWPDCSRRAAVKFH